MSSSPSCGRAEKRPIYRPFVFAALLSTLTLGSSFGAANLLMMHGLARPAGWINPSAHATTQLFGFILLFILGVAFFAVPRFLGTALAHPRLARSSLWFILCGVGLRCVALFTPPSSLGLAMLGVSGAALLCGVTSAAISLYRTWRASPAPFEPFHAGLMAGTVFFGFSAALQLAGVGDALLANDPIRATLWSRAAYAAALFGGGHLWVLGMFLRIGPVFVGMRKPGAASAMTVLATATLGALVLTVSELLHGPLGMPALRWTSVLGAALFALSVTASALLLGVFERAASVTRILDETFRWTVRGCFAALLLSASLLVWDVVSPNHLLADAGRHAFAIGFLLLITFAFATRILPIFAGVEPVWPESRALLFGLVGIGVLLRTAQVVAALGGYRALWFSAVSGVVALVGIAGLSVIVAKTVWPRAEASEHLPRAVRLSKDMTVLQMLDTWPVTLEVMVKRGFEPLRVAALRTLLARNVTLEQACQLRGVELKPLMEELDAAISRT